MASLELFAALLAEAELKAQERDCVEQIQAGLRILSATVNNVSLTGNGNTVANAVTFNNTGTTVLGQSGGTQTYNGGLSTNAASTTTLNGTIASSDA